jgi:hypothetical protein
MARAPKDTAGSIKPAKEPASIDKRPAVESRKFTPETKLSELTLKDLSAILRAEMASAGLSGTHVNSGPPGFVNGGGHANFDPKSPLGSHVNSGPPGFVNGGGHANFDPKSPLGSHVNSGPPGFVNGGGHANFDPASTGGSHVNSGPPGFVNGGGHANFDPSSVMNPGGNLTRVTLPGGLRVDVPATGRFDMTVRGTRITR